MNRYRRKFLKQLAQASTALSSAVAFSAEAVAACAGVTSCLPFKWFFVQSAIYSDTHLTALKEKLDQAKRLGLNGMVLSCLGWDRLDLWWNGSKTVPQDQKSVQRLFALKEYADSLGIEIIPLGFSLGYASSLYARNPHLLEGQLVSKTRFKVANGVAKHDPETVAMKNPGFEDRPSLPNTIPGWSQDAPGSKTFIDTTVKRPGSLQSVRFENFALNNNGLARIWQTVNLKQNRTYCLTFWLKMDNYTGSTSNGVASFNIEVYRPDQTFVATLRCPLTAGATFDWTQFTLAFPSLDQTQATIWIRCADGKSGRVWVDDVALAEAPPLHILNRNGCPVTVSVAGSSSGPLMAGTHYQPLNDPQFGSNYFSYERQSTDVPVLTLTANSPLKNDTLLEVSYYQYISPFQSKTAPVAGKTPSYWGQLVACMTSPELFDNWKAPLAYLAKWKPKRLFLSWDEIRSLHACENCRKGADDPGMQIAHTLVMFARYVEYYMPGTELIIWSDMLDINHNAQPGKRYWLSRDPFVNEPAKILQAAANMVGSDGQKMLKRKPTIMCWNQGTAAKSLKYFSDLGFPVLAATYYDKVENSCNWLQQLQLYNQARGMMYTTWLGDYSQLETFSQAYGTCTSR